MFVMPDNHGLSKGGSSTALARGFRTASASDDDLAESVGIARARPSQPLGGDGGQARARCARSPRVRASATFSSPVALARFTSMSGFEPWIALAIVLLAADLSGSLATRVRCPQALVAIAFGALLAHGPWSIVGADPLARLRALSVLAVGFVAVVFGMRLATQPNGARAPIAHASIESLLVVPLVALSLALGASVPSLAALVIGLVAISSAADGVLRAAHAAGDVVRARAVMPVAFADALFSITFAAVAALEIARTRGAEGAPGDLWAVLIACGIGPAIALQRGPRAVDLQGRLTRLARLAFGVMGVLGGAALDLASLPSAALLALVACVARIAGKSAAASFVRYRARKKDPTRVESTPPNGLVLAPGGLLVVGIVLLVRDAPGLVDARDSLLAIAVCMALIDSIVGGALARLAFARRPRD